MFLASLSLLFHHLHQGRLDPRNPHLLLDRKLLPLFGIGLEHHLLDGTPSELALGTIVLEKCARHTVRVGIPAETEVERLI